MSNFIQKDQLFQLFLAHFREMIREPGVIFWGILFPILMALGLGVAFTKKGDVIHHVAIIAENNQAGIGGNSQSELDHFLQKYCTRVESGEDNQERYQLILKDEKLGNTKFLFRKTDWPEAILLLKRGNLNVIMADQDGHITYHFDPLNPEAQLTFLKLSQTIKSLKNISS